MRISDWSSDVCSSDLVESLWHEPTVTEMTDISPPGGNRMAPRALSARSADHFSDPPDPQGATNAETAFPRPYRRRGGPVVCCPPLRARGLRAKAGLDPAAMEPYRRQEPV